MMEYFRLMCLHDTIDGCDTLSRPILGQKRPKVRVLTSIGSTARPRAGSQMRVNREESASPFDRMVAASRSCYSRSQGRVSNWSHLLCLQHWTQSKRCARPSRTNVRSWVSRKSTITNWLFPDHRLRYRNSRNPLILVKISSLAKT